jgi:hypothetical protein
MIVCIIRTFSFIHTISPVIKHSFVTPYPVKTAAARRPPRAAAHAYIKIIILYFTLSTGRLAIFIVPNPYPSFYGAKIFLVISRVGQFIIMGL